MTALPKSSLRKTGLLKRFAIDAAQKAAWSHACAERLSAFIETLSETPMTVAGYMAVRGEVDIMPALAALSTRHTIALPRITKGSKVLSFKHFMPGDALVKGAYGIDTPSPGAKEVTPDIVIVPMVAFDRGGHRLGYGGGYYDATLGSFGHHPVIAIGVAFSAQEVDVIPAESFDVRVNIVITEKETLKVT